VWHKCHSLKVAWPRTHQDHDLRDPNRSTITKSCNFTIQIAILFTISQKDFTHSQSGSLHQRGIAISCDLKLRTQSWQP
jgi:hypothetical protein